MKLQGVSIVICCHNGSQRLPETIRHIAQQDVPAYIPWEFIIIDNGSTDDSAAVTRTEWQKHRVDTYLRIVKEPVLGLSYARERGFKEARYEYIILCDDDNWLAADYVSNVYSIMSEKPNVAALGGFGKLVYEIDPPVIELSYIFAAGEQAPRSGKVMENKVYGAGCVIRKSAYKKLIDSGFKSLLTDRRGEELSSGGDYELCLALAILGYDIWYDERLRFTHFITKERLNWEYFLRYAYESSKCFNIISSYKMIAEKSELSMVPRLFIFKSFLACCKTFIRINLKRLVTRQQCIQKSLYFRHVIFKYKLMTYFIKFNEMVDTHRLILNFQQSSRPKQNIPNIITPVRRKAYVPTLKFSFFSKPSRQLP
jgi:glycosyltransferase involved in cell wall biosynthesis